MRSCQRHSLGSDVPPHSTFPPLQQQHQNPALKGNHKRCPNPKAEHASSQASRKIQAQMQFHVSWSPPSPSPTNSWIFCSLHIPPPSQSSIPLLQGPSSALSPKPGLEGGCESHISLRNSRKSTPAFNEKVFWVFFSPSALFHSQANKNGKQ